MLLQFLERIFVSLKRQLAIGVLEQLPKSDALLPAGLGVAGQLLVGEAGPHGVAGLDLPLEHLSQQSHGVGNALQGKTEIGGHLPHPVIARIPCQNTEILLERLRSFPFLQKLFRVLHQSGNLGAICSMGGF